MAIYGTQLTAEEACERIASFLEANPDAWMRGTYARDANGRCCQPEDPGAIRFCALGLVIKFAGNNAVGNHICTLLSMAVTPPGMMATISAARFNDDTARDVTDVIAMFRCAAAIARLPAPAFGMRALYHDFVRPLRERPVTFNWEELVAKAEAEFSAKAAADALEAEAA